jgi:hypothetical protein
LEDWLPLLPAPAEARRSILRVLVGLQESLSARLQELDARDVKDRRLAGHQAGVAIDPDAARLKRYKHDSARVSRQALDQLMKLQRLRLEHGATLAEATETVDGGNASSNWAPQGSSEGAASAPETAADGGERTKATAPAEGSVRATGSGANHESQGDSGALRFANSPDESDECDTTAAATAAPGMGQWTEAASSPLKGPAAAPEEDSRPSERGSGRDSRMTDVN